MLRPSRELVRGLAVLAAVSGVGGCSAFSLDGLTGAATGDGITVAGDAATPIPDGGAAPGADAGGGDSSRRADAADAGALGDAGPDTGAPVDSAPPLTCDGGLIACGGACVDPGSDPANCDGCGHVCGTGLCGSSIVASLASAPTGWTFNGDATYNTFAPSAELTPAAGGQAGTFVYGDPVVVDAFDVQFDFRLGLGGGARSDGMGFMIEQSGRTAVGGLGGGLGMTGLVGYALELDVHDNAVCGDTSSDHVGVDDLTLCSASEGTPTSLFATGDVSSTVDLGDGSWHHVEVILGAQGLSATVAGAALVTNVALPKLQPGAAYYFGFAAGTGGLAGPDGGASGFRQEVKNVAITFPTPRCL